MAGPHAAQTPAEIAALAARHGLEVDARGLTVEEAGLDFRVAFAEDASGRSWVLRVPRRPDAARRAAGEARILRLVSGRIPAAVPDWRIHTAELIAYPLLPGRPGLTVRDGGPVWHFDRSSSEYCASLGRLLAQLHAIDPDEARRSGVPFATPERVRQSFAEDVERVLSEFVVPRAAEAAWRARLDDDALWPERTVMTHGEPYPAHLLLDDGDRIASVLDWTTARVWDPAVDFTAHWQTSTPEAFAATLRAYADAGGAETEDLAARCAAVAASSGLAYALFALETGEPDHVAAAGALLADA
ncbi:macrolide 2'-phosphotransferase [Zafaria sp. J156]|uniref:macrolide 2'-phosphotransferase n=1 Tax=Zafaria sp. J156 TaxID=3116490 RepID=UPI002E77553A|nr:macrolide 2'-phosphotransferase [Zafaria sp. J156]MEE1619880.1 macrolide 2'-phosphotransferase [Zafaria sp. J156]